MGMSVPVDMDVAVAGGAARRALRETVDSVRAVFRHRSLRRLQLALAGSLIGDWAYATAVTVWAFDQGGARAVGLWAAIRYVLMALTAPFAATLADRLPRKQVMIGADLARGALVVAAAACVAVDAPAASVYVLATVVAMLGTVFRPAQAALLPSVADRAEELTAANGVSSTLESLAFFVGPAIGAALIAVTEIEVVFLVDAVTFLWSAVLIAAVRPRPTEAEAVDEENEEEGGEGALAEMFAGFTEIRRDRDLLLVVGLVCAQTLVAGAGTVFTVLFAVEILDIGARGVGYVDAVLGVGAVVGGFFAISRATRNKLAGDLAAGVVLWSLPLLLVTISPTPVAMFAAMAVLGFANPLVDVNCFTVLQRIAPDRVLGRVFGALEGGCIATMAIGAAAMPFLVDWAGLRTSVAVIALVVGLPVLALFPAAGRLDRRLREPDGLALLRSLPIFSPLAPAALEALARHVERVVVVAGDVIIEEGALSDRFYVIESGRVAVTHGAELLRHEGPGEYFGEIGLLRDVPRTATVTAVEDGVLLSLGRAAFLDAVAGNVESSVALEDVVTYRMGF
jgi:MFS family permease